MRRVGGHVVGREIATRGLLTSYEAKHDDAPVLLRIFDGGAHATAADAQTFEEQASIASGLAHPGIARPVAWSAEDPVHLSIEPLRGATLTQVCEAAPTGRLDPEVAAALGADLAKALLAAHASGLVHAGLSPETILLGRDGSAQITDFALARLITSLSAASSRVMRGAIECLAPEQLDGPERVGPATDVFGLGAILYRVISGKEPFGGASAIAASIHLSIGKAAPLDAHGVAVPAALASLVMRMIAREPEDRPPLREVVTSLSTSAMPRGRYVDAIRASVAIALGDRPQAAGGAPASGAAPAEPSAPASPPRPATEAPRVSAPPSEAPAPVTPRAAPAAEPAPRGGAPIDQVTTAREAGPAERPAIGLAEIDMPLADPAGFDLAPGEATATDRSPLDLSDATEAVQAAPLDVPSGEPPPAVETFDAARATVRTDSPLVGPDELPDYLVELTTPMKGAAEHEVWAEADATEAVPKTVVLPDPEASARAAAPSPPATAPRRASAATPGDAGPRGLPDWVLWAGAGAAALLLLGGSVLLAILLAG